MELTIYNLIELISGLFLFWTSFYVLSSNPFNRRNWISFGILMGLGVFVGLDPVFMNVRFYGIDRTILRILLEWPVFLLPIFIYDLSINKLSSSMKQRYILNFGYGLALILYALNIINDSFTRGGIIKDSTLVLGAEYIIPGPAFITVIVVSITYMVLAGINILKNARLGKNKSFSHLVGISFYALTILIVFLSYYQRLSQFCFYSNIGLIIYAVLLIYSFGRDESLLGDSIKFGKNYIYKTLGAFAVLALHSLIFLSFLNLSLNNFLLFTLLSFLLLLALAFYDWLGTFLNDLIYNIKKGISVVTDEEASFVLRNFHNPEKLADSPLLRLRVLKKSRDKLNSLDDLKSIVRDSIEFMRPEDETRRTKQNLKYQLLKMIAYDQAEEGQILWELGFDEYPLRIMSNEGSSRPPLFKAKAASDYSYTSRNAYLALKREAIHDLAWRISFLEKSTR